MVAHDLSHLTDAELLEIQFLSDKREEFELMSEEEEQTIQHRARLEASPAEFFRESWNVMEPGARLVWSWHYDYIGEHLKAVTIGDIRRLIINVPPRTAKALGLDTPIPTPDGMKKMKDIHVGDRVLALNGESCTVTAESEVFTGHECYEMEFSTGERIIADAGHLWNTIARQAKPGSKKSGPAKGSKFSGPRGTCSYKTRPHGHRRAAATRTTQEIVDTLNIIERGKRRSNHRIQVCAAIENDAQQFTIHPYLLGAWLGDGMSAASNITCAHEDVDIIRNIESRGEPCRLANCGLTTTTGLYHIGPSHRCGAHRETTLRHRLKNLGIWNNKHIPEAYFHGSIDQRMELMRGLMDTDGTIDRRTGQAAFINTRQVLAEGMKRLAASLGFKASINEGEAKIDGRYISQVWHVSFTAYANRPIFNLDRKRGLQHPQRKGLQNYRTIVAAKKIDSVPVKCIAVDSDDNLYLVTDGYIPTHNSNFATVAWPAWSWARQQTKKFLTASYSSTLSEDHSVKRRRLIESAWYQGMWPLQFSRDTNRRDQYSNLQQGEMIATSVGATAMGRGGDILILDDGFNSSEVRSEKERKTTHDWFVETFAGRLNDKVTGAIVVIEQRTHDDDMTGWLLRNEPEQWTHIKVPLEAELKTEFSFPMSGRKVLRVVGDVLQPERNPPEVVKALKVHSRNFATQYQQRPAPDSGIVFKREWWQYRKTPREKYDTMLTSWDFSVEGKADSDYNVGVLLGKAGADIDVLDVVRARIPFPEQQRALINFAHKWPQVNKHLVEKKANGPAIIASLKSQVSGLIAVEPQGSKLQRYDAASPACEAGNVYLLEGAPWLNDFIEELNIAPNGANDDQADAFSQGIIYLCGRNYGYGLIGYMERQEQAYTKAREEFMERAQNVGKIDTPDNARRCKKCTSTSVVVIGSMFHCNACGDNVPISETAAEKNPAYDRGALLRK